MSETFEYVVLGAGAIGTSAALQLALSGKAPLLLEQFQLGHERGSSHGESRIIRYSYDYPLYVRMAKESYPMWKEIEQDAARQLFLKTGGIDIAERGNPELQACLNSLKEQAVSFELLDSQEINKRYPQFHLPAGSEGLYQEDAGILAPSESVSAMQELCLKYGAEIRQSYPVERIVLDGQKIKIITEQSELIAHKLIICAGGWTGPLLKQLGLDLPLSVSQEQYAFFQPENAYDFMPERFPVFIQYGGIGSGGIGWYGFPIYGRPGVKSAIHQTGKQTTARGRDSVVDEDRLTDLKMRMQSLLPDAAGEVIYSATCLYTNTPDQHFILDKLAGHSNVAYFAGCSGHAFKFAPFIGKLLLQLLDNKDLSLPVSMFSASRFLKS